MTLEGAGTSNMASWHYPLVGIFVDGTCGWNIMALGLSGDCLFNRAA